MVPAGKTIVDNRITSRPAVLPDDEAFLQDLYVTTRDDLQAMFPDPAQARPLLLMQQKAQQHSFEGEFPGADHEIILSADQPIGRVIVDRQDRGIHLVDISILPEFRNRGIGTAIIDGLFAECRERDIPFYLRVLKTNPAQRLYERMGFKVESDETTRLLLKWSDPRLD